LRTRTGLNQSRCSGTPATPRCRRRRGRCAARLGQRALVVEQGSAQRAGRAAKCREGPPASRCTLATAPRAQANRRVQGEA